MSTSRLRSLAEWSVVLLLPALFALAVILPRGGPAAPPERDLVPVIIQATDADAAAAAIEQSGGIVDRRFTLIPAIEARIPADATDMLVATGAILAITPNVPVATTAVATTYADTLYLHHGATEPSTDSVAQPILPMDASEPTESLLGNYDTDRDDLPGLLLRRSDEGLNETDPAKVQRWIYQPTESLVISGEAVVGLSSAIKGFDSTKGGAIALGLYDCTSSGDDCSLIARGELKLNPWDSAGTGGWGMQSVNLGYVNHTVSADRGLMLKLVVLGGSDDDLWFAFGTTAHASSIRFVQLTETLTRMATPVSSVFPAAVGADRVWTAGVTGQGVGIAIVDTGLLTRSNLDFQERVAARVAVVGDPNADAHGHGSHAAGVAAGSSPHAGDLSGIAPNAHVISVKVGGVESSRVGDVIAGLEWISNNREAHGIRVVNLSLSSSVPMSYLKDPLAAAAEALWFQGLVVVTSAGNRGTGEFAVDYAPGNDPFVISVGAFSDNGTGKGKDDFLKGWSSRGVSHDGIAKPEIVAPGWRLIAPVGIDSELFRQNPERRAGTHYLELSGTSTAAPVVSGVVALMLEQDPSLTPDEVKARLLASADRLRDSQAGAVDAHDAVLRDYKRLRNPNDGIRPSFWIDPATGEIDQLHVDGVTWDGVTWDGVTWDGVTWDGVTWDGVTWDGVTWDNIVE